MSELTITEFARMGGHARAKALSKSQRVEIARMAGRSKKKKRRGDSRAGNSFNRRSHERNKKTPNP